MIRDGTLFDPIPGATPATATATLVIQSVVLDTFGSGYTTAPDVTFADATGSGTGATGTAVTQVGTVTSLNLTAGGSGYVTGGGIKKFTDDLPGLCVPPACPDFNTDPAAKYIPLGVPQPRTYDGVEADEYVIGLVQYTTSFSSSLPDTLVRGYVQLETADNAAISQHFPLVNEFLHPIPVTDAAATSTATPGTYEVTVGSATQGTFTLTVDQATTAPIPWDAEAATIEAVLGGPTVTGSGSAADPWILVFATAPSAFAIDGAGLTQSFEPVLDAAGAQVLAVTPPQWLGPTIAASKNKPVRIVFHNFLPTGAEGDLFLPTDSSLMGSGMLPMDMPEPTDEGTVVDAIRNPVCSEYPKPESCFADNRATLHLHGGITPWISDGTRTSGSLPPAKRRTGRRASASRTCPTWTSAHGWTTTGARPSTTPTSRAPG